MNIIIIINNTNHATGKIIYNVYKLPSPAHAVWYLHVAVGLPTKSTWLKSIRNRNYPTWPLITVNMWTVISYSQSKHRRATSAINDRACAPPKPQIHWQNQLQRRIGAMSSLMCIIPRRWCIQTKQGSYPTGWAVEKITKLSCMKLMATPPGFDSWKT